MPSSVVSEYLVHAFPTFVGLNERVCFGLKCFYRSIEFYDISHCEKYFDLKIDGDCDFFL